MLKRLMTFSIAASLLSFAGLATPIASAQQREQTDIAASERAANSTQEKAAKLAARVKGKVADFGTGPRAKVEVKLHDGTKLHGNITEIADAHFTIMDKTKGATTIAYSEVKSIKDRYLPTWMKAAGYISLGILVPVLISTAVVMAKGGQ